MTIHIIWKANLCLTERGADRRSRMMKMMKKLEKMHCIENLCLRWGILLVSLNNANAWTDRLQWILREGN